MMPLCVLVVGLISVACCASVQLHGYDAVGQRFWQFTAPYANETGASGVYYERNVNEFAQVSPRGAAGLLGSRTDILLATSLVNSTASPYWQLCEWDIAKPDSPQRCTKIGNNAAIGEPTDLAYLDTDLIIIACPEANAILAVDYATFGVWPRAWANSALHPGLSQPASLEYDAVSQQVYVGMLDGDVIWKLDSYAAIVDSGWIYVPSPRFLVLSGSSLYVLSADPIAASLYRFSLPSGASQSTATDQAGEWVCTEPGSPPSTNGSVALVRSIAIDEQLDAMYVLRSQADSLDAYSLSTTDKFDTLPNSVLRSLSQMLDRPLALLRVEWTAAAQPSALVDAYAWRSAQSGASVTLNRCGALASGHTLAGVLGGAQCNGGLLHLAFDSRSLYRVSYAQSDASSCFEAYLYLDQLGTGADEGLADTSSDAAVVALHYDRTNDTAYLLRADGSVLAINSACESTRGDGAALFSAAQPTFAGHPDAFFVTNQGEVYVWRAVTTELSRSGQTSNIATAQCALTGVCQAGYSYASDGIIVWCTSGAYARYTHSLQLSECYAANGTELVGGLAPVMDSVSGVVGWHSPAQGILYEWDSLRYYWESLPVLQTSARSGIYLVDALGPAGRSPMTLPPPTTTVPHPPRTSVGSVGWIWLVCIIASVATLVFICGVVGVVRKRNRRAASAAAAEDGDPSAEEDSLSREHPTACLPTRRWIISLFCPCACCYSSETGKLRVCYSCLGGRKRTHSKRYIKLEALQRTEEISSFVGGEATSLNDVIASNNATDAQPTGGDPETEVPL